MGHGGFEVRRFGGRRVFFGAALVSYSVNRRVSAAFCDRTFSILFSKVVFIYSRRLKCGLFVMLSGVGLLFAVTDLVVFVCFGGVEE